ncbi:DUF4352 domain-containing protein [Bacillus alkalicellulosilyticus]|uniref:DUF4352 domain-containing protein n=1 Tax=Alkalihalobacterium alkalicellulosilyticum TaxID=1912214 RepID=UPI0009979C26|nr:DUF4352 domain-containing protein [Bacillus alkalicellulosilyticus]
MIRQKVMILVVLLIVVAGMAYYTINGGVSFSKEGKEVNDKPVQAEAEPGTSYTIGDEVVLNQLALTVNGVRVEQVEGSNESQYVIVDISIENQRSNMHEFTLHKLTLADEEGYAYEHTLQIETKGILGGQISSGRTVRGEVAFLVPTQQKYELVYTDHLRTGQVIWDIEVNTGE